ncbi:MAG: PorV/PorQ family protein [Candidatus Cloacimonetes bacterium]|nr:PorV/PorQ family protein [Candidatus Cloacimonadota bacterium]
MKKQKKTIVYLAALFVLIIITTNSAFAVSEATCMFLMIEPGSRPGGMGHSYVSLADDAYANWWNPGGLAFIKKSDIALMHSNWFGDVIDDMYYEYLGFAQYFENLGTFGFNITYMTYGELTATKPVVSPAGYEELMNFTSYEIAVGGSYGIEVMKDFGLGINVKGVISGLCPVIPQLDINAKGEGLTVVFDVGLLKKNFIIPRLSFGLNLQNLGPDLRYRGSDIEQPMPLNFRAGFSYKILDDEFNKMVISADINKMLVNWDPLWKRWFTSLTDDTAKNEFESMIENIGVEYNYYNLISLRVGYVNDIAGEIQGVSFGGGINYEIAPGQKLSFDFALQPAGGLTTNNKTFSIGVEF